MSEKWSVPGYTAVRELGSGGGGTVVHATADGPGTAVAIKYLSPELLADEGFRAAFRAEAQLLAELDSPNVARLYEYVESGRGAAIVMELVDGPSLRAVLADQGPAEPEAALSVLKGSLLGLGVAHAAGVVHRDYKPANVLVTAAGESKLVDFGVAMRSGGAGDGSGTPAYMPPEQWAGGMTSPRGDIYSATATFVECVSGRPPFPGTDMATLREQHERAPVPAAVLPGPLQGLALRGMSKDPRERPADAAAFLADLERAAVAGYGEDWEERGRGSLARRAALLALLSGAGAAAGGTAIGTTVIGGAGRGVRNAIVAGAAVAVLVGGVVIAVIARGDPADGGPAAPVAAAGAPAVAPAPGPVAAPPLPVPAPAGAPAVASGGGAPAPVVVTPASVVTGGDDEDGAGGGSRSGERTSGDDDSGTSSDGEDTDSDGEDTDSGGGSSDGGGGDGGGGGGPIVDDSDTCVDEETGSTEGCEGEGSDEGGGLIDLDLDVEAGSLTSETDAEGGTDGFSVESDTGSDGDGGLDVDLDLDVGPVDISVDAGDSDEGGDDEGGDDEGGSFDAGL